LLQFELSRAQDAHAVPVVVSSQDNEQMIDEETLVERRVAEEASPPSTFSLATSDPISASSPGPFSGSRANPSPLSTAAVHNENTRQLLISSAAKVPIRAQLRVPLSELVQRDGNVVLSSNTVQPIMTGDDKELPHNKKRVVAFASQHQHLGWFDQDI
jgi:hypothetical protein